jgi:hypothetical protein
MKTLAAFFTMVAALACFTSSANAQWANWGPTWGAWGNWGPGFVYPGGYPFHGYPYQESSRIGKVKIEGDVNYSVTIDQGDSMLGNGPKRNPYGLIVGAGEITKLLLTVEPNADRQITVGEPKVRMPFKILVASLEIRGVNLGHTRGKFASFEDEVAACGRILVWLDHTKRYLLLDSADPARRRVEWPYASSVPPERVFVEGVTPTQSGGAFIVTLELDDSNRKGLSKLGGEPAIWDRQLITVHAPGVLPKPWKDRSPVWANAGGGAGK